MVDALPGTLLEALNLAQRETYTPIAGGTDLMVRLKASAMQHPYPLLFLCNIKELKGIGKNRGYIEIGAAEPLSTIIESPEIPAVFSKALAQIGSPAIRNQGTLGGNICNASPAGDSLPLLYLFHAQVVLCSLQGERSLLLQDFITGPGKTARKSNEILVKIQIPEEAVAPSALYAFEKIGNRNADAISKASFALKISLDKEYITEIDAAFGAMGPRVTLLSEEIKKLYRGQIFPLTNLDRSALKEKLFSLLTPIDDQRSTSHYRKTVALNLLCHYLSSNFTAPQGTI